MATDADDCLLHAVKFKLPTQANDDLILSNMEAAGLSERSSSNKRHGVISDMLL
jgi:hypothetical protein